MPEHDARRRAVYDHADEEPRPTGRRRRQVADWGVGEELFDGMPGRRFERRGVDHPRADDGHWSGDETRRVPSGGADDGRRTIVITEDDVRFEDEAPVEEFASREDALEARRRHDAVWAGDEPFADPEPAADRERLAESGPSAAAGSFAEPDAFAGRGSSAGSGSLAAPGLEPSGAPEPAIAGGPDGIARGGVEGRRTVKIGGRPAEFHPTPRRRPSRTVHERLGPRPDRIAAWAFALGILLILIAIATASI